MQPLTQVWYLVMRNVSDEAPWAHEAGVRSGMVVQRFRGVTYGCCAPHETAITCELSERGMREGMFLGVPTDALMEVTAAQAITSAWGDGYFAGREDAFEAIDSYVGDQS